jgi:thiaminase/transcriptional activator TenA
MPSHPEPGDATLPPEFEIPPFAAVCYEAAAEIWDASFEHPFLQALVDGSLPSDRFRFYQMQDARYLEAYADVCSLISTRFAEPDRKLWFIEGARLALVVERELHAEYGRILGYTADDIAELELTPNARAYCNHMLVACHNGTLLEAVAALAPCPWLYADIGKRVAHLVPDLADDHPYANWLKTYADPEFVTYTNDLLAHLEFLAERHGNAEHRRAAVDAFVLSARYEWMFWDQAYTMQPWPGAEAEAARDAKKQPSDHRMEDSA